jgi:DNA-binding GntR family transcriptional regulator
LNLIKNTAPGDPSNRQKVPAHETVYQRLRAQILFGEMAPGQAVTIQGLTESLNAGMTPVREAIRRLISDGALVFQDNRRVSVPALSGDDIEQIAFLRKTMESELARRAAGRMNATVLGQLDRVDKAVDRAILSGDVAGYLQRNYDFHALINARAKAPILTGLVDRLWLRFGPSLRVVCGRFGTQNLPDRHKDLLAALNAGDPAAAAHAMQLDVGQGMDLIAGGLARQGDGN